MMPMVRLVSDRTSLRFIVPSNLIFGATLLCLALCHKYVWVGSGECRMKEVEGTGPNLYDMEYFSQSYLYL